jgi:hypothetical protein
MPAKFILYDLMAKNVPVMSFIFVIVTTPDKDEYAPIEP